VTNILKIPQMTAIFHIARNADWVDHIVFPKPDDAATVLDITGIDFYAQLRPLEDDPNILVDMSTDNNMLVNSGMTGILSWRVPYSIMRWVKISSGVLDILAIADGHRVNLFQEAGPAEVIVRSGVTIPKLL